MSKRYTAQSSSWDDTDAAINPATDPGRLIHKFLPSLSAHVTAKYASLGARGNCILGVDDLIQIASIELMGLAEKWESIVEEHPDFELEPNGTYDGLFYAFLKTRVMQRIIDTNKRERRTQYEPLTVMDEGEEQDRSELYEYSDGELHDRTGVRRRPDGPWWRAVVNEIMTFWDQMTQKEKVVMALRFYDELSTERVSELARVTESLPSLVRKRWRAHARNQMRLGDDHEYIEHHKPQAWEPPELLVEYLRARHRMDIHEYLGIVTISFRSDPMYIVDALTEAAPRPRRRIAVEQEDIIDRMAGQGYNAPQIAREIGVSMDTVYRRLNPEYGRKAALRMRALREAARQAA